jgi:4-amino-4-deoxy-L-arabinose transferase-like glycosyltransferase
VLLLRSAKIYGPVAALTAACALSFNLFTPRLASLVRTDMPLALVLFAIGLLIWEKIRTRASWTGRDKLGLFLLLSAGMLIKGPIVYAFLLPGLVAFQWRWRGTNAAASAWSGWLPWLVSFLIFLLWAGAGILFVPEFTEHVLLREFAGRFSEEVHRGQPFYFYLPHLLHRFAPWSLLLIGLAFVPSSSRARIGSISPETFWLVAWSLGGLIVMSFVPSKRIDRIFPIVPPLCLLLALTIAASRERERMRTIIDRICVAAIILSAVFITGYTVRKIVIASREQRHAFPLFGRAVLKEVVQHHWRYGVIGGEDEGLLLYVRKTEFLEPEQAIVLWNGGKLDALVVPDDELDELLPRLRDNPKTVLTSNAAGSYRKRYFLLVRSPSP